MFLKLPKQQNAFSKAPSSDCVFHIPTQSKSSNRVFFTKTKDHNYVFEHDIFHNNLKDNVHVYSHKYSKQESNTDLFVEINLPPKISRNCRRVKSLFNITQGYSLQPITLLKSFTNYFNRVFLKSCTKNLGKFSEKRMWWSFFLIEFREYSLQPPTGIHYRYILEEHRKERMF